MRKKIVISPLQRSTHTYMIGQSGTGKSRAMESWIMQDILAGHGVGLIDPHGDLFNNLTLRLASYPKIWERIVLINPFDQKWTISVNPLEPIMGIPLERTSAFMTDVVMKIWKLNPANAPRMLWLITNTFLALSDLGLSLIELPPFLRDQNYRKTLLPRLRHQRVRDYFENEFPKGRSEINQWTSPALNKIGALVFDPDVKSMLAPGKTLNLREVLDNGKILLVNLSKGQLGEGTSSLLGAFLLARIQNIALSRADSQSRNPFYLYLDEFQNYTTDNIKDILTESRKYGLSITFAHQYLDQIPKEIQSAVINTAGTIASFRVSYRDASILSKEIFPSSNFKQKKSDELVVKHTGVWPRLELNHVRDKSNWEKQAQLLSSLQSREFWVKQRGVRNPSKHKSFDMPDLEITSKLRAQHNRMVELSNRKYGQLKEIVNHEIQDRFNTTNTGYTNGYNLDLNNHVPFWE